MSEFNTPTGTIKLVTPEWASFVLAQQPPDSNRTIRKEVVNRIADDISSGRWRLNGESIIFNSANRLLDGQHRLHAIVKANIGVQSMVVCGVDDNAMATIDTGAKRTNGDHLGLHFKIRNPTIIAAAIAWVYRYRNNMMLGGTRTKTPTSQMTIDFLTAEPDLLESRLFGLACSRLVQPGLAVALHYLMSQRDKVLADLFFDSLAKGENLSVDTPVHVLREKLQRNATSRLKEPPPVVAIMVIKAWNATRAGASMRVLRVTDGESVPTIR